jgi:tRNA-dihydrouridine synthase B
MIGRGSYGRPWFIGQVCHYLKTGEKLPAPSLNEQRDIVLEHYNAMLELYGTENGVRVARKHIGWYSSGLQHSAEFRFNVNKSDNAEEVKQLIKDFYNSTLDVVGYSH